MTLDEISVGTEAQTLVPTGIGTRELMSCKVVLLPHDCPLTWLPYGGQVTVHIFDSTGTFRGVARRDLDELRKVPDA